MTRDVVTFALGIAVGLSLGEMFAYVLRRGRCGHEHERERPPSDADSSSDPYRSPVKLAVIKESKPERKKVYCKDCKHVAYEFTLIEADPFCRLGEWAEHQVKGKYRKSRSVNVNKNFDCADYEESYEVRRRREAQEEEMRRRREARGEG